ncbi:MAG: NAD(P)-dependent oxidoreductase [Deltaproteobacteria bacterium]|nr:NAD(P)-dependent oxidoreductase [Deltaproteobacteria bacterium]
MSLKVVFVGMGRMGSRMAARILDAGLQLTVFSRDSSKCAPLAEKGALVAGSLEEALLEADVVLTMVSDDGALKSVVSEEFLKSRPSSQPLINVSFSTVSVDLVRSLTAMHVSLGHDLVSCPVFGRPADAQNGALNLCLAGPLRAKETVAPYLGPLGKVWDFGDFAADANVVKLAGNFMIASLIETLSEAFALVENNDANPAAFFELMTNTLFGAPAVRAYGKLIMDADFAEAGFLTSLGAKDCNLVKKAARISHTPMPFASVLEDRFVRALAKGWGGRDWTVISQLSREDASMR